MLKMIGPSVLLLNSPRKRRIRHHRSKNRTIGVNIRVECFVLT